MKSYISFLKPLWDWGKFKNASLILSSYFFSRLTRKYFVRGMPYTFIIEPSAICNLRCPQCPVGLEILSRPQGTMTFDEYRKVLNGIAGYAWVLLLYFQGESLLNPSILDMVDYAYEKKIFTVISTNCTRLADPHFAHDLAASNLGRLILSVDGATEKTYRMYRQGGQLHQVLKGIHQLTDARRALDKKFPRIDLQCIVMRHNEHEMEDIRILGKELGVDRVLFKSPQVYDFENADHTLPANPKFRRYRMINGDYRLKGTFSGYCKKIWYGSVITWDRKVLPCCFDKNADYQLGSLDGSSFEAIWNGERYRRFRTSVVNHRDTIDMCKNCTEGLNIFFR